MNQIKILLICVVAAVTYGVLHDQVTARLCLEYFTVAHPPLFSATTPTMVGLCWGVAATIGIGVLLGALLALAATAGNEPSIEAGELVLPVARLLAVMAAAAFLAGGCGCFLAEHDVISIPKTLAEAIPQAHHHRFMAVWFAHGASYLVGIVGGMRLVFSIWQARGRPFMLSLVPRSLPGVLRAAILVALGLYVLRARFGTH